MSLNFQFTDKQKFDALTEQEKEQNNCFIWWSLLLDLNSITEKNADEWLWRIKFATQLNGPTYLNSDKTPYIPTLDEIKKRIGLKTNVSNKTRNQFIAKEVRIYSSDNK